MSALDKFIVEFDRGLRTVAGGSVARRPMPDAPEGPLDDADRRHVGALVRVNHTGEVCAQALYAGQALTTRDPDVVRTLDAAAAEETDHLAWCETRLDELDTRPSILNPLFYVGSFVAGAAAGLLGDRISLGFVEATEDRVSDHLQDHLERLPEQDQRTRTLLETMREDELRHGANALESGGAAYPEWVKQAMRRVSRLMTETTYRI